MPKLIKICSIASILLLTGCANLGAQASFSEALSDNFLLTSASSVSRSNQRCVILTKPFAFQSGSVTYSLPAGKYLGTKKNSTGYFYYAPTTIKSSSWFADSPYGIYVNDQFNHGNLFSANTLGYDDRPIRSTVLPNGIFAYIKKGRC